jgi:hypothetical protein
MSGLDELKTAIRRNMLLGMWAAERLGLAGPDADLYAHVCAASRDARCSEALGQRSARADL